MKYIEDDPLYHKPVIELTERNLRVLLAKLKDPVSQRTMFDPRWAIGVRAVDDSEHYKTRPPGLMAHEPEADE